MYSLHAKLQILLFKYLKCCFYTLPQILDKILSIKKSRVNARMIVPYRVTAIVGVTEKVAPTIAVTHYNEYLAKNLHKTNRR